MSDALWLILLFLCPSSYNRSTIGEFRIFIYGLEIVSKDNKIQMMNVEKPFVHFFTKPLNFEINFFFLEHHITLTRNLDLSNYH